MRVYDNALLKGFSLTFLSLISLSPTDWATMALPTAGGRGASGISLHSLTWLSQISRLGLNPGLALTGEEEMTETE